MFAYAQMLLEDNGHELPNPYRNDSLIVTLKFREPEA